jgi:hypothetical protein
MYQVDFSFSCIFGSFQTKARTLAKMAPKAAPTHETAPVSAVEQEILEKVRSEF